MTGFCWVSESEPSAEELLKVAWCPTFCYWRQLRNLKKELGAFIWMLPSVLVSTLLSCKNLTSPAPWTNAEGRQFCSKGKWTLIILICVPADILGMFSCAKRYKWMWKRNSCRHYNKCGSWEIIVSSALRQKWKYVKTNLGQTVLLLDFAEISSVMISIHSFSSGFALIMAAGQLEFIPADLGQ